jgi:YebC/PmpR family DNA-binding regulatory protein
MAGHSHSANIKHKKDAMDKKRAKVFSKIARKLIIAARSGGGDIETNLPLRYAFELARAANMPKDVIQRNIDKGSGVAADGAVFEELLYEGYGPGGVAVMVEILTDNRNRTAPEVKKIFERAGGNMGEPGCVSFLFDKRAVYLVDPGERTEDDIMEIVMEVEAEDMESADEHFLVTAAPSDFIRIKSALEEAGLQLEVAEISALPKTSVEVSGDDAVEKITKLIDRLDDHEDVQNVYSNHVVA